MPVLMVSHGRWATAIPETNPPPGDYEAVIIGDQAPWRITSVDQTWEQIELRSFHLTSPPGLPAVWYSWRNESGAFGPGRADHIYKSTNNGTSWTPLASDPFTPAVPVLAGQWPAWEDHLTAATEGILLTSKYASIGHAGFLRLVNVYYTLDDGATWSQVFEDDLAWEDTGEWGPELLVVNTAYTWFLGVGNVVQRVSHGGGGASLTEIAMPVGSGTPSMLAADATLDGKIVYAVTEVLGEAPKILRTSPLNGELFVDVTPAWEPAEIAVQQAWIAVAGDLVIALAYGLTEAFEQRGSIWRSANAGLSWTKVRDWNADLNPDSTFDGFKAVGVSPNRPNTWFVWANNLEAIGSKVVRSTDGGVTWAFVNLPSADPEGDNDQHYYEVRVLG